MIVLMREEDYCQRPIMSKIVHVTSRTMHSSQAEII